MTTVPGVDYPWSHPGGAALQQAGIRFACRYLSNDTGKNLSRAEADDLAAHGVSCVVVWETTANRAGAGRAAGIADAERAATQAAACGMPTSRPIYFAVDYDASPSAVVAYFQGVASVIGVARTGVYGGYKVVRYLLDHGLARWAWQTAAWSGGQWDARAHIRQPATTVRINGVDCDNDTAHAPDYGQWMPGTTPTPEDDMPLTTAEKQEIAAMSAAAVMKALGAPAGVLGTVDDPTVADDPTAPAKDDQSLRAMLWTTGANAAHANAKLDTVLKALTDIAGAAGADPKAFSAAVAADLAQRLSG